MSEYRVSRSEEERIHHSAAKDPQGEVASEVACGLHIFCDGGHVLPSTHIGAYVTIEADQNLLTYRSRQKRNDQPRNSGHSRGCACALRKYNRRISRKGMYQP